MIKTEFLSEYMHTHTEYFDDSARIMEKKVF